MYARVYGGASCPCQALSPFAASGDFWLLVTFQQAVGITCTACCPSAAAGAAFAWMVGSPAAATGQAAPAAVLSCLHSMAVLLAAEVA